MTIPACTTWTAVRPPDIVPGAVIHLDTKSGTCRTFLVVESWNDDPLTDGKRARVVETGEEHLTLTETDGFTGVSLNVKLNRLSLWHKAGEVGA